MRPMRTLQPCLHEGLEPLPLIGIARNLPLLTDFQELVLLPRDPCHAGLHPLLISCFQVKSAFFSFPSPFLALFQFFPV